MKRMRLYVDTSVIGGCLDDEFAKDSCRLMEAAKAGRVTLLVSAIMARELDSGPPELQAVLEKLPPEAFEDVPLTEEILALRDAYIDAHVVGPRCLDDTGHVAAATVARADAIVSWNFRHIVRLDKIKAYNQANLLNGYGYLVIVSPKEVQFDDTDES